MMATTTVAPARPSPNESRNAAIFVVLLVLVALGAGWALKTFVERRSTPAVSADGSVALAYPSGWAAASGLTADTLFELYDPNSHTPFRSGFRVTSRPVVAGQALGDLAILAALNRSRTLREYGELSNQQAVVSGRPAVQVTYGYVADPPAGAGPALLPIVVQGTDTLVLFKDRLYTFTGLRQASAAPEAISQDAAAAILDSVRLK
jgi:hypothetical protein